VHRVIKCSDVSSISGPPNREGTSQLLLRALE
jgi:hypothetical protein